MAQDTPLLPLIPQLPGVLPPHPLIRAAGPHADFAWGEFFAGQLRNRHTRIAYRRALTRFLDWLGREGVQLRDVMPAHVGLYFDQHAGSVPSKKLALAAIRRFFDILVTRHVIVLNPATSVRGERYQAIEGKTPEVGVEDARKLLASIEPDSLAGKRDRAIIGTMIYTAARVGAIAKLRRLHYYGDGIQHYLRFEEKGGKSRELPVRHDLQELITNYLVAAGLECASSARPLFCTLNGRTGRLTDRPFSAIDACRMLKKRLSAAGLSDRISPHSFRVCTITDLLSQGVALEDVQYLAGHADPRTTRLYDRRQRRVTRNIVERISV
ncbi:MAG: tyrosine-type recombinase/integrase [Gemmataceae bacterium]